MKEIFLEFLHAKHTTGDHIQRHPSQRTVFYSDSLSCLQILENKNHPVIREIIQILTYLKEVASIIEFCWIPGHIGI